MAKRQVPPTLDDVRSATAASTSGHAAHAVVVGPAAYYIAWLGIYLVHIACALYCFAGAALLHVMQYTYSVSQLDLYHTILPSRFFPMLATTHNVVGAIHTAFALEPIARWLVARLTRVRSSQTDAFLSRRLTSSLPLSLERYVPRRLRHAVRNAYASVFARHGLLGIESQYFDRLLLIREVVECALQTYQAYQMSLLLSRRALTRLFVATLVANCWITPLLHHGVHDAPRRRLLDRLSDVALDFLASIGVPLAIVWGYRHDFDVAIGDVPFTRWRDDVWSMTMRNESALVFFGSWLDALSRLVFSLGLLLSLDDVKFLLRKRPAASCVTVHPLVALLPPPRPARPRRRRLSLLTVGHRVLFVVGVVVLAVHLHSELQSPKACPLALRPWFVAQPTCVIVEFSCYTNPDLTGVAADVDAVFAHLHAPQLTQVSFRHCHVLAIQPAIQRFPNLRRLTFYNTTVQAWGAGAALTTVSHPHLEVLTLARTDFPNGILPDGLLSYAFPRSLGLVALCVTNLQALPDDLDARWPSGLRLVIEFSRLTAFAPSLARLRPMTLSLTGNAIRHVPPEAFDVVGQLMLVLSANPITFLPEDATPGGAVVELYATNLSAPLPEWLVDATELGTTYLVAGRTPYCKALAETDAWADGSTISSVSASTNESGSNDEAPWSFSPINCADRGEVCGFYRLTDDERESEVW